MNEEVSSNQGDGSGKKFSRRTFTKVSALATAAALSGLGLYLLRSSEYEETTPPDSQGGTYTEPIILPPKTTKEPEYTPEPTLSLEDRFGKPGQLSPEKSGNLLRDAYVLAEDKEKESDDYKEAKELWCHLMEDYVETSDKELLIEKEFWQKNT
jgi:hypothetical protein